MRGIVNSLPSDSDGGPHASRGTQHRGHFSRTPIKFQRHQLPPALLRVGGLWEGSPGGDERQEGVDSGGMPLLGSGDSSCCSSPELGVQREVHSCLENTRKTMTLLSEVGHSREAQSTNLPSAPKQKMRPELDSPLDLLVALNRDQSNNGPCGRGPGQSLRRPLGEQRSAQIILSGLKSRRGDSANGEPMPIHYV